MDDRFSRLPRALVERARWERLAADVTPFGDGGVPALLAHPDPDWWAPGATPTPRPTVVWIHGRTVSKELDPGRYLRWLRAGIATCAIDLPAHGERLDEARQGPDASLAVIEQCVGEIDLVLAALASPRFNGAFDARRLAIGGMSAGGMVSLMRLCREHPFACAAVEATAGNLRVMEGRSFYDAERVDRLNPMDHLRGWRPIPLLALHSRADQWIPVEAMEQFIDELRAHHHWSNADPELVEWVTWPETGAPEEHVGFGRFANDAKNTQTLFLQERLETSRDAPPAA
jgi:dienelactone hydrolase